MQYLKMHTSEFSRFIICRLPGVLSRLSVTGAAIFLWN